MKRNPMRTAFVTTFDLSKAMQTQKVWANPYLVSFFVAQALIKQALDLTFISTPLRGVYERFFKYKATLLPYTYQKPTLLPIGNVIAIVIS